MIETTWKLIPPVCVIAIQAMEFAAKRPGIVTCAQTAQALGCSVSYMEVILGKLRDAGLVTSQRGPGGGYRLARTTACILLGEIIQPFIADVRQQMPAGLSALRDELEQQLRGASLQSVMTA